MARFLLKRILNMIPLIIGITFISFLAMSLVPGDFLSSLKLNPSISPDVIRQMQAEFGSISRCCSATSNGCGLRCTSTSASRSPTASASPS